jgi:chorismate dehydratase
VPLRISTISFLNPAPLLYNFEHEPAATTLREHYDLHYTSPSICADELNSGIADLGLIPIASLTPSLAIVPGCTIASLDEVRSILLLVKNPNHLSTPEALSRVRSVATDTASRSSIAYARILFEHFHSTHPAFTNHPADALAMLTTADAALLIGDPALLAREHRAQIAAAANTPLLWLDLAHLWREHTNLPWVAAVWAIRPESLTHNPTLAARVASDLTTSRDAGLSHIEQLVAEWTPRLAIPPSTIRTYLIHNIHYTLDPACLRAIELFRTLAASINAFTHLPKLNFLSA